MDCRRATLWAPTDFGDYVCHLCGPSHKLGRPAESSLFAHRCRRAAQRSRRPPATAAPLRSCICLTHPPTPLFFEMLVAYRTLCPRAVLGDAMCLFRPSRALVCVVACRPRYATRRRGTGGTASLETSWAATSSSPDVMVYVLHFYSILQHPYPSGHSLHT